MAARLVLAPARVTSPRGAGLPGWRRAAHGLAIVAGWVLFLWGWHRVLVGQPDFSDLRVLMLGAAIVVPVVTVSWILHNRGIHRRKGPRRHVPSATLDYRVDFHGLEVTADFGALVHARRVEIVVDAARKAYRVPHEDEAAPGSARAAGRRGHAPLPSPAPAPVPVPVPVPAPARPAGAGEDTATAAAPAPAPSPAPRAPSAQP